MTLYSSAPPARTFQQDKPTLLVAWWCTLFSSIIILFRVAGRYVRTEKLFREDRLAFACLIPLFLRMAFVHVILLYGTNNAELNGLSELSVHDRVLGSRLVLASRISYAATLWMLKFTITEFLKRLTLQIWRHSYEVTLRCIRWFLLLSFIAILLSDLLECHPFTHYWQVKPDPGPRCRQGYVQLLTTATCNILTDLLLVIFPIPIILGSAMPLKRKLSLICLFALSVIPIAVTFYQIPLIINKGGRQQTRSLWASIEILAATAVANALVLGSFVRDRGVKKQKWKVGSITENLERTISIRGTVARAWGSDEDLVRDLGLGVDRELRHHRHVSINPRPAPMATPGNDNIRYARGLSLVRTLSTFSGPNTTNPNQQAWNFAADGEINPYSKTGDNSEAQGTSSEDYDLLKTEQRQNYNDNVLQSMITPRKLSFFDVGGLLESEELDNNHSQRASQAYTNGTDTTASSTLSTLTHDFKGHNPSLQRRQSNFNTGQVQAFPHPTALSPPPQHQSSNLHTFPFNTSRSDRRGSAALLQDLGGLIAPLSHAVSTPSPDSRFHSHLYASNGIEFKSVSYTHPSAPSHSAARPPSPTSRPIQRSNGSIITMANRTQNAFSLNSMGRTYSSSGPSSSDDIQMRPIRPNRSASKNEDFQDVGGLLN